LIYSFTMTEDIYNPNTPEEQQNRKLNYECECSYRY